MNNTTPTLDLLQKFVDQRPGLNFADYGDVRAYRNESAEITRDRSDFYELLRLASSLTPSTTLEFLVKKQLNTSSGRLTLDEGHRLQYITGQYFPTEYRPAACRVLVSAIWFLMQLDTTLQTGHDIRKAIRRRLKSRRVARLYFS
jgi:hypothetical protein